MGDPRPSITLLISAILLSVVVMRAEQQGVKMKITVSTSCNNKTMETWYLDLNRHLTGTECTISSEVISRIKNNMKYTVLFERLNQIVLSKSSYKITSFVDLLCILHVPLVDRSKTFQVFKIHNLPLPLPPLNKQMRHKLDHQYLAISTDRLYVTFPTVEEIFSCRMNIGSFCEINNAIYPTSAINLCEYALFMEQPTLVRKLCKIDLVNFTRDQAFSLDSQFWVILTV